MHLQVSAQSRVPKTAQSISDFLFNLPSALLIGHDGIYFLWLTNSSAYQLGWLAHLRVMLYPRIKFGPGAFSKGQYENAFESPTFEREVTVKINEPVGSATISPCGRDIALAS